MSTPSVVKLAFTVDRREQRGKCSVCGLYRVVVAIASNGQRLEEWTCLECHGLRVSRKRPRPQLPGQLGLFPEVES